MKTVYICNTKSLRCTEENNIILCVNHMSTELLKSHLDHNTEEYIF